MSRELDVRVAEALGGRRDDDWGCLIPPEQKAKPDEMWPDWQTDGVDTWREPVKGHSIEGIVYNGNFTKVIMPHYSTDIAAAWSLVEQFDHFRLAHVGETWQVEWAYCGNFHPHVMSDATGPRCACRVETAPTAPEAICRAFLKAKRE